MADKQVFQTMNGLRGVAALAVVAFHWTLQQPLHLKYGYLAVDFFFVLSGFVIAHSYDERLKGELALRDFILTRLVRLYPLYLGGTFLAILVIIISFIIKGRLIETNVNGANAIPYALLMLPTPPQTNDWAQAHLYPLNGPAWSLLFELIVNIIYAMSVRLWTEGKLIILMTLTAFMLLMSDNFYGDGGWNWSSAYMGLLQVFYSFPAGVLIYKLYKRQISFPAIPSPATVVILLGLLMLPYAWGIQFSVLVGFPLLVALAATSEPNRIFLPIFSMLGAASYAIYAIHQPLHGLISATLTKFGLPIGLLADVILMILIIPICVIIDSFYDTPVRKYLVRKLLRRARNSRALETSNVAESQLLN